MRWHSLSNGSAPINPKSPRLYDFARIQQRLGQYQEAEPRLLRALAIREKALGPEHADVGRTLNRLGNVQRVRGRNTDAELSMKRSIAILEKALGPDDPDYAGSLNDLGLIYRALGGTGHIGVDSMCRSRPNRAPDLNLLADRQCPQSRSSAGR